MNRTTTILTATSVAVAGIVAYAFYFDYKRRNDLEFRKQLRKDKKKAEKTAAAQTQESTEGSSVDVTPEQLRAVLETIRSEEPPPTQTLPEREKYFMTQISIGEQLAVQGPDYYLAAATSFYRAMRVYPTPMELIAIYDKTVPKPIFQLVMELTSLDVKSNFAAYYDHFPPKSMAVGVEKKDSGSQGSRNVLIARKDFEAGDLIYKEQPIVAALDVDVQAKGTHCTQCFRIIQKGMAIPSSPSDPLSVVYCSKPCQLKNKAQSHNLLFTLEPPLPIESLTEPPSPTAMEARQKAQILFAEYLKKRGHAAPLLVARFIGRQVQVETAKQLPNSTVPEADYPAPDSKEYSMAEQMEHLRFLQVLPDKEELKLLTDILLHAVPGLELFVTDDRYATLLGKMTYNSFGVCFGGGRDERPKYDERPEDIEYTRTPYGTSRQIGCGLYGVSAYLSHSCVPNARPSFSSGTSELHLIATKPIKKGEELTVAYVDVVQKENETPVECRRRRRMEIARGWRFACVCSRCTEEAPAAVPSTGDGDVPTASPTAEALKGLGDDISMPTSQVLESRIATDL